MLDLIHSNDLATCNTLGVMVMDESGSMGRFDAAPLEALEAYVRDLQTAPEGGRIAASIITFSNEGRVCVPAMPVRMFPTSIPYLPSGNTRLYGTVRDTLRVLLEKCPATVQRVVLAVLTDGADNATSERSRQELVTLAAHAIERGHTLLTFGIGVDARAIAERMGFPPSNAKSVAATAQSVIASVRASSSTTSWHASSVARRSGGER